MASRKSTRHGASASTRRTATRAGSGRGSTSRTRSTGKRTTPSRSASGSTRTQSRSASRLLRNAWTLPLVALGLVAVFGWAFYSPLRIQYQESREQARLESELASLQEQNESLSAQVERLKTPEGVEEVARESLGMVKQGENLYVVIDPAEETTAAVAGPPEEATMQDSVWDDLLDLVFGVR